MKLILNSVIISKDITAQRAKGGRQSSVHNTWGIKGWPKIPLKDEENSQMEHQMESLVLTSGESPRTAKIVEFLSANDLLLWEHSAVAEIVVLSLNRKYFLIRKVN